jgi:hypothetical protein
MPLTDGNNEGDFTYAFENKPDVPSLVLHQSNDNALSCCFITP